MSKHGEFNWNEIQTHDPDAVVRFYTQTIGWEFQPEAMPAGGTYWIGLADGVPVCGVLEFPKGHERNEAGRWVAYIHVDDLDAAIDRVEAAGGHTLRDPWVVPGVGRVAWIRDSSGAEIGWVTPEGRGEVQG